MTIGTGRLGCIFVLDTIPIGYAGKLIGSGLDLEDTVVDIGVAIITTYNNAAAILQHVIVGSFLGSGVRAAFCLIVNMLIVIGTARHISFGCFKPISSSANLYCPCTWQNSRYLCSLGGLLRKIDILISCVHQIVEDGVLGIVVEGVGFRRGEHGGGGAVFAILLIPYRFIIIGLAVLGAALQIVIICLTPIVFILFGHRVEQTDRIGVFVQVDRIGGLSLLICITLYLHSTQREKIRRNFPHQSLSLITVGHGQLNSGQACAAVNRVSFDSPLKCISGDIVFGFRAIFGCIFFSCKDDGRGTGHLHVLSQLIGKNQFTALTTGTFSAFGYIGRGRRCLIAHIIGNLAENSTPVGIGNIVVLVVVLELIYHDILIVSFGDIGLLPARNSGCATSGMNCSRAACVIITELFFEVVERPRCSRIFFISTRC